MALVADKVGVSTDNRHVGLVFALWLSEEEGLADLFPDRPSTRSIQPGLGDER